MRLSTADQRGWDDFAATWRAGREAWLLDSPTTNARSDLRRELDTRLREDRGAYRSVLGFAYLVLAR